MTTKQYWPVVLTTLLVTIATIIAHRVAPSQSTAISGAFIQSLHGPGFAVVAAVLFFLIRPYKGPPVRYLLAGSGAFAIAVLAEVSQIPGHRNAQVVDLLVDAAGIAGAMALLAALDRKSIEPLGTARRLVFAAFAAAALAVACGPSAWYAYAYTAQRRAEPALLSFEHAWESATYLEGQMRLFPAPSDWPVSGSRVALTHEQGSWGLLIHVHPFPDWSRYSAVTFVASSTSDTVHDVTVDLRDIREVNGKYPTRMTARVLIGPDPERFRVRFDDMGLVYGDASIDMHHVGSLILSATKPGSDVEVLVDDFRLEL